MMVIASEQEVLMLRVVESERRCARPDKNVKNEPTERVRRCAS